MIFPQYCTKTKQKASAFLKSAAANDGWAEAEDLIDCISKNACTTKLIISQGKKKKHKIERGTSQDSAKGVGEKEWARCEPW